MQQISPEIDTQADASLGVSGSQDLSFSKQSPKATNFNLFLGIGFLVLFLTSAVFIWQSGSIHPDLKQNDVSQSVPAQPESDESKLKDLFYKAVPKPLEEITIYDLPNYRKIQGAAKYKNNLWFTGTGNIIEYNLQTNSIMSYSDANKIKCMREIVTVNDYFYTVCNSELGSSEHILKINPETHVVEKVISTEDGLLDDRNYELYPDGELIWIATSDGLGSFNTVTEEIKFYTTELGFNSVSNATQVATNRVLVDHDYVWVENTASAVSRGGLTVYTKATGQWKAFGPDQIKDIDFGRIDLEGLKLVPGGIQIGFRNGNIGQFEKFVEKQYLYDTGTWDKVNIDRVATGEESTKTYDYIEQTYPPRFDEYTKQNSDGFGQIVLPDTNEVFQVNGRDNYIVSPVIDGKKYVLTSASIDIIDDSSSYPQILLKLGKSLDEQYAHGFHDDPIRNLAFLVEPESKLALVMEYICAGDWCSSSRVGLSVIDLKSAKIIKEYEFKQPADFNLDNPLTLVKKDNKLVVLNPDESVLVRINLSNYKYELP